MTERQPQTALPVANLDCSLGFYRDGLGFSQSGGQVIGPGGVALLLVERGAAIPPGVPGSGPGAWVYLQRPDLPGLAAQLVARGMEIEGPVEPYPGYRHLLVPDPDGYVLAFWESLPVSDEQILALYREGPGRLRQALAGLADTHVDLHWAPGKWTVRQIVHHLVDSDLSTFYVLRMALALPEREIRSDLWAPDAFTEGLRYGRRPVEPAVTLFEAGRAWILDLLEHLPDPLAHAARWPSGYRAEVRDLLRQAGGHAIHHILQIEDVRRQHGC